MLRPGERTDVGDVLADGGWWATVEGTGKATIALATDQSPATWRHRVANGRGEASIDAEGSRLILEAGAGHAIGIQAVDAAVGGDAGSDARTGRHHRRARVPRIDSITAARPARLKSTPDMTTGSAQAGTSASAAARSASAGRSDHRRCYGGWRSLRPSG